MKRFFHINPTYLPPIEGEPVYTFQEIQILISLKDNFSDRDKEAVYDAKLKTDKELTIDDMRRLRYLNTVYAPPSVVEECMAEIYKALGKTPHK